MAQVKQIEKDEALLIGSYEKLTRDIKIKFKCRCGIIHRCRSMVLPQRLQKYLHLLQTCNHH